MPFPVIRGLALLGLALVASAGTVAIPFHRRPNLNAFKPLSRRDDTIELAILSNITSFGYYVDLGIGTPPQTLPLLIDTGSPVTWVSSVDVDLCNNPFLQRPLGGCVQLCESSLAASYPVTVC